MTKYTTFLCLLFVMCIFECNATGTDRSDDTVNLPIIMYHNVSANQAKLGKFVITPEELERDLVFIREHDFNTVTMADIIRFVNGGEPLPQNPIMLTFDDGDYAIEKYVLPLLKKYDMKAVVSIIGGITDKYSDEHRTDIHYPNLTWQQINELTDSGYVEIQNHTYDLHKSRGVKQKSGELEDAYKERLRCDLVKMNERIEEMTSSIVTTIVYPYGLYSASTNKVIKELGFTASLTCREKINILEAHQSDCLYGLGRLLRPHGISVEKLLKAILSESGTIKYDELAAMCKTKEISPKPDYEPRSPII